MVKMTQVTVVHCRSESVARELGSKTASSLEWDRMSREPISPVTSITSRRDLCRVESSEGSRSREIRLLRGILAGVKNLRQIPAELQSAV
jgi:hypothetical protein